MNREEEIGTAAFEYICRNDAINNEHIASVGFISGAEWADEHPNSIDMGYLQSWYQASIDETQEPIWTDKHIEELFDDFYLIPKNKQK